MKNIFLILVLIMTIAVAVSAQESNRYFSHNGQFYFDYPADWVEVDYDIVDLFLSQYGKSDLLDYDAVFAPKESNPFIKDDYFFVILKKFDTLTEQRIETELFEVLVNFERRVNHTEEDNILAGIINKVPNYNNKTKEAAILSDIEMPNGLVKKNLILLKFYEKGMVSFYCFAPDSIYNQSEAIFLDALNSFDTLDFNKLLPKENLKLADIDVEAITKEKDDSSTSTYMLIFIAVLCLIAVLVVSLKKKKNLNK